jgi:O-antigen biosynthesis protein
MKRYDYARPSAKGRRVADIACGSGYGSHALATDGGALSVVGVDNSVEAIEHCHRNFVADNLEFRLGDAASLDLASDSVDLVVSFETIEHLRDPGAFLDGVLRILKPGGLCIISTPNKKYTFANPYHLVDFSPREFDGMLRARFSSVRFLGQDRLPVHRRLTLSARVLLSRRTSDETTEKLVPRWLGLDYPDRSAGGIVSSGVGGCRFLLALCQK